MDDLLRHVICRFLGYIGIFLVMLQDCCVLGTHSFRDGEGTIICGLDSSFIDMILLA